MSPIEDGTVNSTFGTQCSAKAILYLIKNAVDHDQTLNFYISTAYLSGLHASVAANIQVVNPYTGSSITVK